MFFNEDGAPVASDDAAVQTPAEETSVQEEPAAADEASASDEQAA